MIELSVKLIVVLSIFIRVALMIYGHIQDKFMTVKYTDVDYAVFTDAAEFVLKNDSPYKRSTYRYTPILAFLLQINLTVSPLCGKVLFCLCDIVVSLISMQLLKCNKNIKDRVIILFSFSSWLLNPLSITVSTRGNAESFILVFIILCLYYLTSSPLRKMDLALSGFFYGISVHLKFYPICYSVAIYFYINYHMKTSNKEILSKPDVIQLLKPTTGSIIFGGAAFAILFCLTFIFYILYGNEFIHETYLYHITRKDVRHNFSPYFYLLYLSSSQAHHGQLLSIFAFIPQVILLVLVAARYYRDVVFSCFVETFMFVTFNKVCTSQYFLWYLGLLPLVMWSIDMTIGTGLKLFLLWITGQGLWLLPAYMLEFQGENTFIYLWLSSLLFLIINTYVISQVCSHYRPDVHNPKTKVT